MLLLDNPIQPYDWGPTDGIARLVGTAPTGGPEAELWVGTHPRGSSVVAAGPEQGRALAAVVASDPVRWLGEELAAAGHTGLPFLLKVLAIGSPLSLQAHPSAAQARAGFAREEAAGVPIDAAHRLYRDASAKPEVLVALTDTRALCGFRPARAAAALVAEAGEEDLAELVACLSGAEEDAALRSALVWLLHLDGQRRGRVAAAAARAAGRRGGLQPWATVADLAARHPGDPGCLAPLLLEVVELEPGAAVHLPAGNLHAYLAGAGVEVMASSDNVLRGGLTSKHIDVDELVAVLRFHPGIPAPPRPQLVAGINRYDAGEEAFAVGCTAGGSPVEVPVADPMLVLTIGGTATVARDDGSLALAAGQAAFVPPGSACTVASDVPVWLASTGAGLSGDGDRGRPGAP